MMKKMLFITGLLFSMTTVSMYNAAKMLKCFYPAAVVRLPEVAESVHKAVDKQDGDLVVWKIASNLKPMNISDAVVSVVKTKSGSYKTDQEFTEMEDFMRLVLRGD